jgi:hypothetical protein
MTTSAVIMYPGTTSTALPGTMILISPNGITNANALPPVSQRLYGRTSFIAGANFTDPDAATPIISGNLYTWFEGDWYEVGSGSSGANTPHTEVPEGLINGSNVEFTLSHTPVSGSLNLYLNGVEQSESESGDFTMSGATITFNSAPLAGYTMEAQYLY